jgi:capsular exopolysaccharide synthesis family protein
LENLTGTASILWRGKYLVAAGLVAGIAVAVAITKLSTRVYESSVIVQVQSDASSRSADVLGLQQASQGLATTYATLMGSRSFLARIRPQVEGGRYSTDELASRVGAGAISQSSQSTNLIELTAQGPSPRSAQALADGVAQAFVSTVEHDAAARAEQQQTELQSRIGALTGQINRLLARTRPSRLPTIAEQLASLRAARGAVTTEMATAIANGVARQGSVAIVGPSTEPEAPIKPRPLLNGLVGVALGLMLGVCLAWIRSLLDRHLHRSEEVPELVELPVLASIPLWRGSPTDELVTREGYDVLRTNLAFVSPGKPPSVLVVTSYESGEGKTATAAGLARAAASHGGRALIVDGDLRTRALSAELGCLDEPGLVNVMVTGGDDPGDFAMSEVVRELEPGLFVLPAGPPPPNPPSLLANPRTATLIWQLRFNFDLIVIDAPPIGRLADAAILAGIADSSIVISRVGRTKKADLVSAVEALKRTPTPIAGVVVFERRSLDSAYYPAGGSPHAVDLAELRPVAPLAAERRAKRS